MRINKLPYILFITLFIVFYSCKRNTPINKDIYRVFINEQFEINLKSNRTTGYSWSWDFTETEVIKLVSNKYIPTKHRREFVGSGGISNWKFEGNKAGTYTIKLFYSRGFVLKDTNTLIKTFFVEVES